MNGWSDGALRGLWSDLPAPPPGPLGAFLPPRIVHSGRIMSWEEAIFSLAAGDPHVVVLSGPGGCGKTTLLLELARVLIDSESADPAFVRLVPGPVPGPAEIWRSLCTRAHVGSLTELAASGRVRVLIDAGGHGYADAAILARDLAPPPGIAVWIAARSLAGNTVPRSWDPTWEAWSLAPPNWMSISLLLRKRGQAALLARLADGEAQWALRDPFLLGLLSRVYPRCPEIPREPGPLLDALAQDVAGKPGDRGRQVLVADMLPALAAAMESAGVEEWPDHEFRRLAFEIARTTRLPLRPQEMAASAIAAEVLVRRGPFIAFCHPAIRQTFAAWDLTTRVTRSGTGPLLAAPRSTSPLLPGEPGFPGEGAASPGGSRLPASYLLPSERLRLPRRPQSGLPVRPAALAGRTVGLGPAPLARMSDGMATRVVARMTSSDRLQEVADVLLEQGRLAALADGLVECRLPSAGSLREKVLGRCRDLLAGQGGPPEELHNPRAPWYEEPLAALVALGTAPAYDAVREGLERSLAAFARGLEAAGLGGAAFCAPVWTASETDIVRTSPDQVAAYLEMERAYLRAVARALRYLDGNRFVAEIAEGRLHPPVVRALMWDTLSGDLMRILSGPAAQAGAALLDAHEARAWPPWILQTLPPPWGRALLTGLGCLAGPAGDPLAYLGWPPRRSEGFINVIQGLWHESLAAVERRERHDAEEALDGLLEAFATTWNGAPEGTWDAIPGRPVGRLAHFFLSMLHRHVGERESLRAGRGLNAALLASEPGNVTWHLERLREVLRVERAGFLSPRQARLLGVALRFIPVRDRRLASLFGRLPSRTLSLTGKCAWVVGSSP